MSDHTVYTIPILHCEIVTKKGDIACEALMFVARFCLNNSSNLCLLESGKSFGLEYEHDAIISGLKLPVMIDKTSQVFHSGLSICCRMIIRKSVDAIPENKKLLGFKCTLLKNYESRCDWRSMFERGLPNLCDSLLHEEGIPLNDGNGNKKLTANTVFEYLAKLDSYLLQPAIIYNAPGFAKRLLKTCKKKGLGPQKEFSSLDDLVLTDSWYALSTKFKEILTHDVIPNIFFAGLEPSVVDLIAFFYLSKIVASAKFLKADDFLGFPQLIRWSNLFLMVFPEFSENSSMMCFETLSFLRKLRCESWTINSLIPETDTNFVKNPPNKNQGRWLPRGGKRTNLVSIVNDALHEPAFEKHPGFHVMQSFDWNSVPKFADVSHFVPEDRSERKRFQVLNIVTACAAIAKPNSVIVDFCSGGGHVGLLLAHFLPSCLIILLDNKLESLEEARKRIEMGRLSNVKLIHCSIEQFTGHFDVGVSLHACGPSTDIVLAMCYNKNAGFVVCPCCYGNIRFVEDIQYPRSELFRSKDITSEEFNSLTKGADNSGDSEQRDDCMRLVDYDRLSEARELGYSNTILTKMEPSSCSPKNSILIGSKSKIIQVETHCVFNVHDCA